MLNTPVEDPRIIPQGRKEFAVVNGGRVIATTDRQADGDLLVAGLLALQTLAEANVLIAAQSDTIETLAKRPKFLRWMP